MKKSIVMVACVSITLLHGMEERRVKVTGDSVCSAAKISQKIIFNISDTKLELIKGSIVNANNKVDIIVLDRSEQYRLQESCLGDSDEIGDFSNADNKIYCKQSDDESKSDDDTYHHFGDKYYKNIWKKAIEEPMDTKVTLVVGPRIGQDKYYVSGKGTINGPCYHVRKKNPDKENSFDAINKEGDKAVKAALDDLAWCTKKILTAGITKNYKKIAMVALGVEVGIERKIATPITAKVIIDFIKDNAKNDSAHRYEKILLYVKKRSEFLQYSEFFTKAIVQK